MEAVARTIEGEAAPAMGKILLVAPPARGGLARHVISLLAGLKSDGYGVAVACDPEGPIAEAARDRSVSVFEIAISPGGTPPQAALAAARLARAIGEVQAQVVHTHGFSAGLVGALALALASSGRLVATLHNYPPYSEGMQARRRRDRWALRLLFRGASRIITVSDALRRDLLAVHPEVADKTVTILNGIDTRAAPAVAPADTRSSLGMPEGTPLVGMIARLAPQKGIRDFIEAARAIVDLVPGAEFLLAGDGPLREEAESVRRELKLEGCLQLLGEVESPRDLMAALDVLVIASVSEGSSIVAMEAMSLGRPVVATAVGGVPEVVADKETGLLVEPGDPEALARAVVSVLEQPELAAQMGERARRRAAAEFDVRRMLEETEAVYADLVREEMDSGRSSTAGGEEE